MIISHNLCGKVPNIHFNSQVLAVCQYLLYLYILENKSCDYLRVNSYLSKPKKIGVKIYDPKLGLLTSRKSYRYEQGVYRMSEKISGHSHLAPKSKYGQNGAIGRQMGVLTYFSLIR